MKSDNVWKVLNWSLLFSFATLIGLEYYILDYATACNKYHNLFIYL